MLLKSSALIRVALFIVLIGPTFAWAQDGTSQSPSARDILQAQDADDQLLKQREESGADGSATVSTPLSALLDMVEAMRSNDYEKAGEFLDRRYLPEGMEDESDEDLLKALAYIWNQQNITNLAEISDEPRGKLDDGLPAYREQVGSVTLSTGEIPIYLQLVPDGRGGKVWKLSNATVAHIPQMWEELGYSPLAIYLSERLPAVKFMGMDNWQVLGTVLFFLLAWPLAVLASYILMRLALLIPNRFPLGIERFFRRPLRFFLFIVIARQFIGQLGLSLKARILLESSGMDLIAWTVLLLGLMSLIRDYQIRKMQHAGNTQYVALLKPFTTILKVITVVIIALYWATSAGYDMSTILAGVGVGSLAVALAAQKTLENIIGAATLYTARPVSAGDFCRFGTITGTVEEIGLRSTLLRTLNRTMVVIPNSVFASKEIENYSHRDRIRYFRKFRLQLGSAEQLRVILAELRKIFLAHPEVIQETVSIRFEDIQDANAILRLDAGINTTDFQVFLAVAEDLNLRVVETALDTGAIFSGPGQFVQFSELKPTGAEQLVQIKATLQQWRDQDRLPFPDFDAEELTSLKNTLDYPPKG
ncbi:MAG: mechanosensitive ion channel [Gemmatimonadales bacterium]|nr:MAG: mechanosensitive ion channel [Gemmatimonadales bacterium]